MRVFISSGESSGDRYAAECVRELRVAMPDCMVIANGGDHLLNEGVELIEHVTKRSTIGFIEPIRHIPYFLSLMAKTKRRLRQFQPDVVILIDQQGVNIPLAKWCYKQGVYVVSLFSPQFWMWGSKTKATSFLQHCHMVATVFKDEHAFYSDIDPKKTQFIGHPLVTHCLARSEVSKSPIIGVFPGSRAQEVRRLFPIMLDAIVVLKSQQPSLSFKCVVASPFIASLLNDYSDHAGFSELNFVESSRDCIAEVSCSMVSSGTITLEHALIGTPCLALYRFSPISYWLAKWLIGRKVQQQLGGFMALPNILLKKMVIPELLQEAVSPGAIVHHIDQLLNDLDRRATITDAFDRLRGQLSVSQPPMVELVTQIRQRWALFKPKKPI